MKRTISIALLLGCWLAAFAYAPLTCNLPAPTNFSAEVEPGQATFSWNPVPGASGYLLIITDLSSGAVVFNSIVPHSPQTVTGLDPTLYQAQIAAVCSNGIPSTNFATIVFTYIVVEDVVELGGERDCDCEAVKVKKVKIGEKTFVKSDTPWITLNGATTVIAPHLVRVSKTNTMLSAVELKVPSNFTALSNVEITHCSSEPLINTVNPNGSLHFEAPLPTGIVFDLYLNQWQVNSAYIKVSNPTNSALFVELITCASHEFPIYAQIMGNEDEEQSPATISTLPHSAAPDASAVGGDGVHGGLLLSPNPCRETLHLDWQINHPGRVALYVTDVFGRVVLRLSDEAPAASGLFSTDLETASLPAGSYRVVLVHPEGVIVKHLVKQ